MTDTQQQARTLRVLERQARALLASLGAFSGDYDSARIDCALGHLSSAVTEIGQARLVLDAQARHDARAEGGR